MSHSLFETVLIACGSVVGVLGRFALGQAVLRRGLSHPLVATLGINLSGCLAAGLLLGRLDSAHVLYAPLMIGLLGSYTTVSSFSLEALTLWQWGRPRQATIYVVVSMIGGPLLALAGWVVASGEVPWP